MYKTVKDIRTELQTALNNEEYVIDKSGVKTIEILGASFIADEESIFGSPDSDYIDRELEWYLSQSLNVNDIPGKTPKIWNDVSSNSNLINSNYGYLIYNEKNFSQYENVKKELKANPYSRRAVMIYTRPSMHYEYNVDGMSDFICTNAVQYCIRNNNLDTIVQMRSNDVVFGYRNDYAWQKFVQDRLAEELNIESGKIYWQVGSLHVYERHFNLIK
jgi:thymidylate synthase